MPSKIILSHISSNLYGEGICYEEGGAYLGRFSRMSAVVEGASTSGRLFRTSG